MKRWFHKIWLVLKFLPFFIWEILVANLRVAYEVLTPNFLSRPGVIAVPLDCKTDLEITLLTYIITLTPGTLALDVSIDKKFLYIHSMFITSKKAEIAYIKRVYEQPILELFQ